MLSVKASLFGFFLIAIINYYGNVNAQLQCYICNGCQDVSEEELKTCSIPDPDGSGSGDEPDIPEPDETDPDTNPVEPEDPDVNPEEEDDDDDEVPVKGKIEYKGSPHVVLRGLKQSRDDAEESSSRCVVAWFEDPETNEKNIVRGCSFEPTEDEARCREVVGEGFTDEWECTVCDENGCNSAGQTAAVLLVLVIGVVINILV